MDRTARTKDLHDLADRLQSDAGGYEGKFSFPVEDVIACLRDDSLQMRHSLAAAKARYKANIGVPTENTVWLYFESPALTWETLCGRTGWMVIAKHPLAEIAFFLEIMS